MENKEQLKPLTPLLVAYIFCWWINTILAKHYLLHIQTAKIGLISF